ncbi:hypothetical protein IFM89_032747 [Coptis chinensis]|uniref:Uncharacterized protein n=1 Tax=Coptis chinensis TaxID=261450 RepID=A0A835HIS3_9MAGN|nr:hypothetical protein IFM89_032747 [Coptis chinensis]
MCRTGFKAFTFVYGIKYVTTISMNIMITKEDMLFLSGLAKVITKREINESEKKLADRLSSVIDVVNDRKLPPELRGQRNAVRMERTLRETMLSSVVRLLQHRLNCFL